ncbi:MAG: hypothetical protein KJI71_03995 [Patescibacteria group bacterium]|nr:hypothetical protein [Patescibacteria group bacterium]
MQTNKIKLGNTNINSTISESELSWYHQLYQKFLVPKTKGSSFSVIKGGGLDVKKEVSRFIKRNQKTFDRLSKT